MQLPTDGTPMAPNPLHDYLASQRSTAYSARMAAIDELMKPIRKEDFPPDPHERIADLLLTSSAMWSLLEERGVTREEVHQRIEEIREAQEAAAGPTRCSKCESVVGTGRSACQFCGEPVGG